MDSYTISLTIGHNVRGVPTFTTGEVCAYAADFLGIEAFTAMECVGMWQGEREASTRIEVCGLDLSEARRIRANVPTLAAALAQSSIMCETRPDRVQFVDALTIEAARTA